MMIAQELTQTQNSVPDMTAITSEMEQTRMAFHQLLGSLSQPRYSC